MFTRGGRSLAWFSVAIGLYFIGFSLLEAIMPSLETRLAPAENRGTAVGLFNMSQYLGSFGGALLGGMFLQRGGDGIALRGNYWVLFVILAGGVAFWALIARKLPMPTRQQAAAEAPVPDRES